MTNQATDSTTAVTVPGPLPDADRDGRSHHRALTNLRFAALSALLMALFFAAAAPSPLLVHFQQRWGFSTSLLTVAFAVYALTILATLLVVGSLSDHIGRKPVLIASLILLVSAMVLFLLADGVETLILARAIQGIATGAASGSLTAAVSESAPATRRRLGPLISGLAPLAGLALGGLTTGALEGSVTDPATVVFMLLVVVFTLGIAVICSLPETAGGRPGALRSLLPSISVPRAARREFLAGMPMAVSTWSLGGLYLGLGPTVLHSTLHLGDGYAGLGIATLTGTGAAGVWALARAAPRTLALTGTAAMFIGTSAVCLAVDTRTVPLFFVASIIAGGGFGATFSAYLRLLTPPSGTTRSGELYSAMYLVNYLAFGLPSLIAGQLVSPLGLLTTLLLYCLLVAVTSLVGFLSQIALVRRAAPAQVTAAASACRRPVRST